MKNILITLSIIVALLAACNAPISTPASSAEVFETQAEPVTETTSEPIVETTSEPVIEATSEAIIEVTPESAEDTQSSAPQEPVSGVVSGATTELTEDEILALQFMREEEKLARDVYLALYDIWGLQIFNNIASSEQTHTDAVKTLIDRYGITDTFSPEYGVFIDPDLQAMYDQLVAQGSQSLGDAIKVGAAIEEIDILDLEESLEKTDKADIIAVYNNLLKGSENHLRAFVSTLERQTGEVYEPQYMSSEAYIEVISASSQTGNLGRGGRKN